VDVPALCPADCQVLIKNDDESGFSRIQEVLKAKKRRNAEEGVSV
jgi:hypothetical protein